MSNDLKNHVEEIARRLSEGFDSADLNDDGEEMTAFDYLSGAFDIEYIIDRKGNCIGGRILIAFGGPNIWIDTRRGMVDGYWWGKSASASYEDSIGLEDALEELWNCR